MTYTLPTYGKNLKPQIPMYNTNAETNNSPFRFNENFNINESNEASLGLSLWSEACYKYGNKVIYIEREVNTPEHIFGEYLEATLKTGTPMYLMSEELQQGAWGGSNDLYSKFGLQTTDEATWTCPITTFSQAKRNPLFGQEGEPEFLKFYPKVNDLIYYINAKKLFEIQSIEQEIAPSMYAFGNRNGYQIKSKVYSFSYEKVSTEIGNGIPDEIKALNSINPVDNNNYNVPIQNIISTIIDTNEADPLA